MLRKGKSNNYWGDSEVPNRFLEDLPDYQKPSMPILKQLEDLDKNDKMPQKEKEAIRKRLKTQN